MIGTLPGKGAQRGLECQVEIVRLLDPGEQIDNPQRRRVLGYHRHDAVAPDVSTRRQMGQRLVYGPPIVSGVVRN